MRPLREKIALVGFLAILALGAVALGGYIVIGHNWNVAASVVDETIGGMDGYTVVLYEGTLPREDEWADEAEGEAGEAAAVAGEAAEVEAEARGGAAEGGAGAQAAPGDATASGASPGEVADEEAGGVRGLIDSFLAQPGKTSVPEPVRRFAQTVDRITHKTVAIGKVAESYRAKGAEVLVLDLDDLAFYEEGLILQRGDKRFGVFSITRSAMRVDTQDMVQRFERSGVDCVIALVPERRFAEATRGIDIVISAADDGLFVMGETLVGTFYVDGVEEGHVGAVVLSPTNVPSGKVVAEL